MASGLSNKNINKMLSTLNVYFLVRDSMHTLGCPSLKCPCVPHFVPGLLLNFLSLLVAKQLHKHGRKTVFFNRSLNMEEIIPISDYLSGNPIFPHHISSYGVIFRLHTEFPMALMGVLVPGSAHAQPSARKKCH